MNNFMIIWYGIIGIVLIFFLVDFCNYLVNKHKRGVSHHKLFDRCKERDLFYVPGDSSIDDEDNNFDDM